MRCYAGRVQLGVLVLVLLLTAVHAEDRDDEPTGLSTRLRAIDESAEFEADHPERLGADPADAAEEPDDPEDPTAAPADEGEPAAAPSRSRRPSTRARTRSDAAPAARAGSAPSAPAAPLAPSLGSTLESPIGTSPLAPSPSTDDD